MNYDYLKSHRVLAYLSACLAVALSFYAFEERRLIGFPDGFLTEWDRMRRILLAWSSGLSLLGSTWFIFLGRPSGQQNYRPKLILTGIAYVIFMIIAFALNHHLSQLSGRGG